MRASTTTWPVEAVRFDGADGAPRPGVLDAIAGADAVVVRRPTRSCRSARCSPCPACGGGRRPRGARRRRVADHRRRRAEGPADRLLTELGHEDLGRGRGPALRPDRRHARHRRGRRRARRAVEAEGLRCVVADTIMQDPAGGGLRWRSAGRRLSGKGGVALWRSSRSRASPRCGPATTWPRLWPKAAPGLPDGDVLVVTQKIVSKAEGRLVPIDPDDPLRTSRSSSASRCASCAAGAS